MTFPERFGLALDPRLECSGLRIDKCKTMDSKKVPLWLHFTNAGASATHDVRHSPLSATHRSPPLTALRHSQLSATHDSPPSRPASPLLPSLLAHPELTLPSLPPSG